MNDKSVYDEIILTSIKKAIMHNKDEAIEAYILGKPVIIHSGGTIEVIHDYYKKTSDLIKEGEES